jgi:hypothetical protein
MNYSTLSDYHRSCLPATNYWREQQGLPIIEVPETDENYKKYYKQQIEVIQYVKKLPPPMLHYYKAPITNLIPYKSITLKQLYQVIRGEYFQNITTHLRALPEKQKSKYKRGKFDYATFSGTFSERYNDQLITHSGLICIDFDHIDVPAVRAALMSDANIETDLMFTSPSGDGVKWVTSIDLSAGTHQDYYDAFLTYFESQHGLKVDSSCVNVSRACFIPHDPTCYINPKHLL